MTNPAPLADVAPPEAVDDQARAYRPTFNDLWKHCLTEREHHDIWRADFLRRIDADMAAQSRDKLRRMASDRAKTVAIYDALLRMVDRVQTSPIILDELRRIAAIEAATNQDSTEVVT